MDEREGRHTIDVFENNTFRRVKMTNITLEELWTPQVTEEHETLPHV